MSKTRGWRNCGCYGIRARKPSAPFGLPFVGRHWAYVGESSSRRHRDAQHLVGGGAYSVKPKDWADLDPKVYPLPCPFPHWRWTRKAMEKFYIALFWPVYNVQYNRWNPRRITPVQAKRQRYARDMVGRRASAVPRMMFRAALLAAFLLAVYLYTK